MAHNAGLSPHTARIAAENHLKIEFDEDALAVRASRTGDLENSLTPIIT